jgi:hypothetical protein
VSPYSPVPIRIGCSVTTSFPHKKNSPLMKWIPLPCLFISGIYSVQILLLTETEIKRYWVKQLFKSRLKSELCSLAIRKTFVFSKVREKPSWNKSFPYWHCGKFYSVCGNDISCAWQCWNDEKRFSWPHISSLKRESHCIRISVAQMLAVSDTWSKRMWYLQCRNMFLCWQRWNN